MSIKGPAQLRRFKNSTQGLKEFAALVEQSDPRSREMILQSAMEEDHRFTQDALRKVVYFEELIYLEEAVLAEILGHVGIKVLAYSLQGMDEGFRNRFLKQLSYRGRIQVRDEEENMGVANERFILGAQAQILKTARSLDSQGKIVFELNDCPRFHQKRIRKDQL